MTGNRFFKVNNASIKTVLNSATGNSTWREGYVGTVFTTDKRGFKIPPFRFYMCSLSFDGGNAFRTKERFHLGIDILEDLNFLIGNGRARLPFNTTCTFTGSKIT